MTLYLITVVGCKGLHDSINLHGFTGQSETPEELSQRLHQDQVHELVLAHEGLEHVLVEVAVVADIGPDLFLGETTLSVEKVCNLLRAGTVEES